MMVHMYYRGPSDPTGKWAHHQRMPVQHVMAAEWTGRAEALSSTTRGPPATVFQGAIVAVHPGAQCIEDNLITHPHTEIPLTNQNCLHPRRMHIAVSTVNLPPTKGIRLFARPMSEFCL